MTRVQRALVPLGVFFLIAATALLGGYFRDEFYYLACSRRLAWGYVDHPPLCVALLWAARQIGGESLITLRIVCGAASAGVVWLTGSIARRLGAGGFGELLAMTAAAVAPGLLAIGSFYSMNVVEVLLWTAVARALLDAIDENTDGRWAVVGLLLGLGLLNKISMLWLGAGIAVGLASGPSRRLLLSRGPWLAAGVAGLLFLPHIYWQIRHGWPTLEFIRHAGADKMQSNPPLAFLADQVMNMHPLTLPVWGAGIVTLFALPRFKPYRVLGVAWLVVAAILILNRTSRSSYLLPAYPMVLAAGGAFWETHTVRRSLRIAVIGLLLLAGASTAPLALPLLPAGSYVRYAAAFGVSPSTEERKELGRLPQFFADRQGWNQFVESVGRAWARVPADERARAAVFTSNYGEAGAVEQLGRLPGMVAISGHNNYWLWGPGSSTGDPLLVVGLSRQWADARFAHVEQVGETECGDCMPYENHQPIFLCRQPRRPFVELWPGVKHFD